MTIGDRMRKRRIELGYSQEEVAFKLGYKSRSSVNKMECSRKLPIAKVEKISEILECSPAYLMGWENPYSDESALLDVQMSCDSDFKMLYTYWMQLSDIGKKKALDNISDLAKIYNKA